MINLTKEQIEIVKNSILEQIDDEFVYMTLGNRNDLLDVLILSLKDLRTRKAVKK